MIIYGVVSKICISTATATSKTKEKTKIHVIHQPKIKVHNNARLYYSYVIEAVHLFVQFLLNAFISCGNDFFSLLFSIGLTKITHDKSSSNNNY